MLPVIEAARIRTGRSPLNLEIAPNCWPIRLSFLYTESRWLSDFTVKQMQRPGNPETVLLPAQFIL